jgi:glycosyltransferase involved in cell wall biosynthesis
MDSFANPKITVLMPVYNCELYIQEAVDSILNQTFTDFEFLIIDDASSDKTVTIIKTYNDLRIKLIEKPLNTGYTNSLNYGLTIASGEYIARMDGDDISLPERFAKQVAFLDKNLDVVLCGTALKIIDSYRVICYPEFHEDIKLEMLKRNCIVHPSVMFKKSVLNNNYIKYDISKEPAEDYNLWTKLLLYGKLYNFQEVLLYYRVHQSQVSQKRNNIQVDSSIITQMELLDNLNASGDKLLISSILKKVFEGRLVFLYKEIIFFNEFKKRLLLANSLHFFESIGFENYLNEIENKIVKSYFLKREKYNPSIIFKYFLLKRNLNNSFSSKQELKLLFKSIIFWNVKKT